MDEKSFVAVVQFPGCRRVYSPASTLGSRNLLVLFLGLRVKKRTDTRLAEDRIQIANIQGWELWLLEEAVAAKGSS